MANGSKGKDKSAASVKMKSNVDVQKTYPKSAPTISVRMNKEEAIKLARNLFAVALDPEVKGVVTLTARRDSKNLIVLGRKVVENHRD